MPEITEDFLAEKGLNTGSLSALLGNKKEFKLSKEIIDVLFSDNESKIIQSTEFDNQELRMATIFEMVDSFIISPYCFNTLDKERWKTFKKRVYQMRVSKDRKGRTEMFDAIKSDIKLSFKEGNKTQEIK